MQETSYGLKIELPLSYEDAVERTTAALKDHGFGVLTTIDVKATLKAKLDREFRKYTILGACNPPLASRALDADIDVGLLLPCNVIVYDAAPGRSVVAAMAPKIMVQVAPRNAALETVASEADGKLRAALRTLETAR
ncbi:MAG TPA: DUF302 domain-containing protein [Vicinamibacterales bacterium]|nr:DUF302 domain-containing protein [Vicinamibacterales bacterium]